MEHVLQKSGRDAAVVHARPSAIDDSICIEALTATLCAKSDVSAFRRGIDGLQMTFVDLQSAVPKLSFDNVGNRRGHTVAYNFQPALQVPAEALLFLDRQTKP